MKPALMLAALIGLAGCAGLDPDAAYPNAACRSAMYADPDVRAKLKETSSPNASSTTFKVADEAKAAAYERCVGAGSPGTRRGGVQKVTN